MRSPFLRLVSISVVLCALIRCNSSSRNTSSEKPSAGAGDSVSVFPVSSFIKGQLHLVDSFQLPTLKYTTVGNRTDSTLISLGEFRALAQEFLEPDINDPEIARSFKETSFADQTINAVTFTYKTDDNKMDIRRVDVIVSTSAVMNDKVRSIYMEKQKISGDTVISKKLYWRADRNYQIITSSQVGEQSPVESVIKVEWNKL